ncbi:methyltransferase [Microbacterium sp. M1A1_1b]|uniref:methyltransferase n=1 Tax=Curtobacterium sp. VKM Ac-2922 TaxID=2929475 RepID=UPI001FB29019|nr:methyltransferase [Curtobacterium sp. VKM Ac-2922]MCJ1713083.1 methyltransferase [Curtobacterium sp. VKM Ac-2922]
MTNDTMTQTWVAVGPAGAVGSIHREPDGFRVELYGARQDRGGRFPSLETAKGAVHKALGPLAARPEFHPH